MSWEFHPACHSSANLLATSASIRLSLLGGSPCREGVLERAASVLGEDPSVIRDFAIEDQDRVRALVLEGLRERWGDAFDPGLNSDLDDIHATYVARHAEVVVIECQGAVVATGTLVPERDDTGSIVRMSVALGHRRQGLGQRVVEELVARARRRAMTEVHVLADTAWLSALALYRSCGFDEVGRDSTDTHFTISV